MTPAPVDRLLNRNSSKRWKHSEHLVPCWAVTGLDPLGWERIEDGVQIKPDNPELGENGKPKKYVGATGYDAAPLFLETDNPEYWGEVLKDVTIPLFITEGAIDCCIGVIYITGFYKYPWCEYLSKAGAVK